MSQANVNETFFTAVGCMDGRVQGVVALYGQQHFGATYPDTITEAGLVAKLKGAVERTLADSLRSKMVDVSLNKHHSEGIIVHGHAECAGNPVDDSQHKTDIQAAVAYTTQLVGNRVSVKGVFIRRSPSNADVWEVEEVV